VAIGTAEQLTMLQAVLQYHVTGDEARILNLLREMQPDLGLSMLFISHDLAVARYMSYRIMVMSNSVTVESGDASAVYTRPTHSTLIHKGF
jgi:ABC-type glutathione transport system ATPase component